MIWYIACFVASLIGPAVLGRDLQQVRFRASHVLGMLMSVMKWH